VTRWLVRLLLLIIVLLGGAVALAWTPDRDPQVLRKKYADERSRFVDLGGGLRVHLRDEGPRDAPVLVLLHGSNASLHTWEPWVERLRGTYRIIRYDQPGHGLTGPHPQARYRAQDFVDVLERVRQRLGVERFVLAGNSMGGWVSWNYAVAHPDRLRGLVLVDASGPPDAAPARLPIGFRIARSPIAPFVGKLTPRPLIERSVKQSMFVQAAVNDAMVDRYHDLLLYPGNRTATLDRARAPREVATPAAMARITAPTLILWGAEDALIPTSAGRWFDRHIPDSTLIVWPEVGHIPMEEAPDLSARALADWLARLPS
jgi:pimeloyl-ACP methyl ester carboxylesterase